ncbi:MAG TPA: ATP-binding protein [Anaerolineales bacterium]|nr:ATP-binding protein [Anaerolineales bacterium]
MSRLINPFIYSRAVTPAEFLGRETELRRLFSRLATGQSTAIIGQPHVGKTSMLNYVMEPSSRQSWFGPEFDRDLFRVLDAQMLRSVETQAEFWNHALKPLADAIEREPLKDLPAVPQAYAMARENRFGNIVLGQLFAKLRTSDVRYLLFLDEFDDLLSHPVLNSAEFYGGLRSLASTSGGLVLVLGSRRDVEQLNNLTQTLSPHGSPYFNVFTQITLGPLSDKAFLELLDRAGDRFDARDRQYITLVSGRYPFLAQAAAAKLWEAHDEDLKDSRRYESAGRELYAEAKQHFADTWRVWSNETRKAITAVALSQIPRLLGDHKFLIGELVEKLSDYEPELEALETLGMLTRNSEGERVITQGAFLWWLTDELKRNVRDDAAFGAWLQAQEMDGLFTRNEKQKVGQAAQSILAVAGKGATTLIESFAKGMGEGAVAPLLKQMGL